MTYQQPGAYPGVPPYPGGAGLPPKPPAPQSVRRAFQCMIGGAVLSVISVLGVFVQLDAIRSAFVKGLPGDDHDMIDSLVTATIVATVVIAVIETGLWLWMAFAAKAGKNYARILGTVFFAINAAGTLFSTSGFFITSNTGTTSSTFASSDTVVGQIMDWLTFLVGLAAVVLLWRKSSSQYFKPEQLYPAMPYGYPGYAYGYPGYAPYGLGAPMQPMQAPYPAAPYPGAAPYAAPTQEPQSPPPGPPQG